MPDLLAGLKEEIATRDKLISKQAIEIDELKTELFTRVTAENQIQGIIYCIGGPLNDNKRGYTKTQLVPFAQIANLLDI